MSVDERAVLDRASAILQMWWLESDYLRRGPSSIPPDERSAAAARYTDLHDALEELDVECPLAEAMQSPSPLVREAILLALGEAQA